MADKPTLLHHLNRQTAYRSLSEIDTAVPSVPERTLRRWLTEWVEKGVLQRSGRGKGTRYRSASAVQETNALYITENNPVFSPLSQMLLKRVDEHLYTRPPVTYNEEWVNSYVPNETFYLTFDRRAQLHSHGKRPAIHGRAGTYIQKIYNRLRVDLSYNSARLEGNTYTLADTEQLLFNGVSAPGKLDAERVMILNHKEAIRYLVQNVASLRPDEVTIRTLHYLLADNLVAPEWAGQIRNESVAISGTTYAPLEGKERLLRLLLSLLTKAQSIDDPFEQSFFLLGHLSYLQAFVDVNKRTARLASVIPLIINDYVPQSFIDVDKHDYLSALICFYEFNEVRPLAELYGWSYLRACQHYDTSVQVLGFDELAALYRTPRRALVADVVRSLIPPSQVEHYIDVHWPAGVEAVHRAKFRQDLLTELKHLDIARIAGMGLTRQELEAWLKFKL